MPSLERFFPPIARFFDTNVKSLPNSRLYFYRANSTTLKATFKDKVGEIAHANPVEADASGKFPPIFLSGLYRVELRSKDNIVQPGWPVDNVGQDSAIVPFAPWSEIVTYQTDDVVTSPDGFWFRSLTDNNLGNDPDSTPAEWELVVIPIAANFTSDVSWATWSDSGTQLSLDIDIPGMAEDLQPSILIDSTDDLHALPALDSDGRIARYYWSSSSQPANVPAAGAGFAKRYWYNSGLEGLKVRMRASNDEYLATKTTTWGAWVPASVTAGDGISISSAREISVDSSIARSGNVTASGLTMTNARILGKSGASPGAIEELSGPSAALILEESDNIELGGDFPAGEFIKLTKRGNIVSITTFGGPTSGALDHALGTFAESVPGVIPAKYRPEHVSGTVYHMDADAIRRVSVNTGGTFILSYFDYSGTPYSTSSSETSPIITYTV